MAVTIRIKCTKIYCNTEGMYCDMYHHILSQDYLSYKVTTGLKNSPVFLDWSVFKISEKCKQCKRIVLKIFLGYDNFPFTNRSLHSDSHCMLTCELFFQRHKTTAEKMYCDNLFSYCDVYLLCSVLRYTWFSIYCDSPNYFVTGESSAKISLHNILLNYFPINYM